MVFVENSFVVMRESVLYIPYLPLQLFQFLHATLQLLYLIRERRFLGLMFVVLHTELDPRLQNQEAVGMQPIHNASSHQLVHHPSAGCTLTFRACPSAIGANAMTHIKSHAHNAPAFLRHGGDRLSTRRKSQKGLDHGQLLNG